MPKPSKKQPGLNLGWLARLPKKTPPLEMMLVDLGSPSARALGKALGVHERTVVRWRSGGLAPRSVMLALYYATSWGRSDVNCQAVNDASHYFAYAAALRAELEKANAQLARMGQIGDFGSANDPAQGVPTAPATPPASAPQAQENRSEPLAVDPVSHGKTARFSQSN